MFWQFPAAGEYCQGGRCDEERGNDQDLAQKILLSPLRRLFTRIQDQKGKSKFR